MDLGPCVIRGGEEAGQVGGQVRARVGPPNRGSVDRTSRLATFEYAQEGAENA